MAVLRVELFEDGGIRVVPPEGRAGITTAAEMVKWVEFAVARGSAIRVTGRIHTPLGRAVIEQLPDHLANCTIEESMTKPWKRGWTSLMWAAEHGLVAEVVDLLERGVSPEPPWGRLKPYQLAMRRGHVDVLTALREAGAEGPVLPRPPGAPDAVVMRHDIGRRYRLLIPMLAVAGLVVSLATRSVAPVAVGTLITVFVFGVSLLTHFIIRQVRVAVDGRHLYYRRFKRWSTPVDLEQLLAVGLMRALRWRSPPLLRLANLREGEPLGWRTSPGFDPPIVEQLRRRPEVRVLTVYLGWRFLRPGLERYIARYIDSRSTLVSSTVAQQPDGEPNAG